MSAKPEIRLTPPPKFYNSKCTACGTPVPYPFHMCNDCARQGVHFSGMESAKKVKKPEPKK